MSFIEHTCHGKRTYVHQTADHTVLGLTSLAIDPDGQTDNTIHVTYVEIHPLHVMLTLNVSLTSASHVPLSSLRPNAVHFQFPYYHTSNLVC